MAFPTSTRQWHDTEARRTARKPRPAAYPKELQTLGDHLRKRRLDLGFLQRDVAQKLGVREATIYNWESNRKSPQLRFLPRIIEFLGYVPYDTQPQALGKRIVLWRRMLGLTQREVAQRLGVDPGTLGCWERDGGRPSKELRERLDIFLSSVRRLTEH
ncbi:MAG TPA: helix-turn-helix transcriptional regulator [Anaerolineae bacterium]|nr:helix-turn-helix transcriptional regulator [Anaerolineae bacterium]